MLLDHPANPFGLGHHERYRSWSHMSAFDAVSALQPYRQRCEDCVSVFTDESRIVVAVADGAGGTGHGEFAARASIREIESAYRHIHSAFEWTSLLRDIDHRITDGQTTIVVVDVRTIGIAGASVGDSRAIIVGDGQITDLTANQNRKPLLGTGDAKPVGFVSPVLSGWLLVGTDGFFNYAKPDAILRLVANNMFETMPRKCIELVRLPSGKYWDDIGIVAVRRRPHLPSRQRYTID